MSKAKLPSPAVPPEMPLNHVVDNELQSHREGRASRDDWIRAALQLLGEGGIQSITIDALCERLQLTKGSFYWHFKSRQELLSAMAASWATLTQRVYQKIRESGLNDMDQLHESGRLVVEHGLGNIDGAMRIWAQSCKETRIAVTKADNENLRFLQEKYINLGVKPKKAKAMARMAFAASVGAFAISPFQDDEVYKDISSLTTDLIKAAIGDA